MHHYITTSLTHLLINNFSVIINNTHRLHLPREVVENGKESATYAADNGSFSIRLPKKNVAEHFEGLDMLTKLLTVPTSTTSTTKQRAAIEVIGGAAADGDEDDFDWHFEQQVRTEQDDRALLGEHYGFANRYAGVFNRLQDAALLIDLREPDCKSQGARRDERIASEQAAFDDDHYLADLYEQTEDMDALIARKLHSDCVEFTDDERFRLKNLPRREYLLDKAEKRRLLLGVVDILIAYAYDTRVTEGEHSTESAWTISKLSATLSWLEQFDSLRDAIIGAARRSLIFPLFRSWRLTRTVLADVERIVRQGRTSVLKCFLTTHKLFNDGGGESRYILNDLFITDYCVWLQRVKQTTFAQLADAMADVITSLSKDDMALDLPLLERAAQLALDEQSHASSSSTPPPEVDVCTKLDNLTV